MRLELHWSQVEALTIGTTTRLVEKTLSVDVDELRVLLEADARLQRIRLDLVHPGELCRIARVFDVMLLALAALAAMPYLCPILLR
jgi:hypothetical protein